MDPIGKTNNINNYYASVFSCPPAAQFLLLQSKQGDLVGHHLRLSEVLERISQVNCEPLYETNNSDRKQKTFLI
jgi:hypothetical protein